jgi:hypothetical protein
MTLEAQTQSNPTVARIKGGKRRTLTKEDVEALKQALAGRKLAEPAETPPGPPTEVKTATEPLTVEAKGTIVVDSAATAVVEKTSGDPPSMPDPLLLRILSTRRKHGSTGDTSFRLWLFNALKVMGANPRIAVEGNIVVEVDTKSTVLFSCHVDSVHGTAESNSGTAQELNYDPIFGHIFLKDTKTSGCLGGDDGVGVYIMMKMIEKKVKGKYIFHTGEEVGGVGSRAFVREEKKFVEMVEQVVAFDRAVRSGENPEVIISQRGEACASKEYGEELARRLNLTDFEMPYITSTKGVFTDSANYADYVAECVNLGCFYVQQHTPNETVDVPGVEKLLEAACRIDWSTLPIKRKAEPKQYSYGYGGQKQSDFYGYDRDYDLPGRTPPKGNNGSVLPQPANKATNMPPPKITKKKTSNITNMFKQVSVRESVIDEMDDFTREDFLSFVENEPELAASAMAMLHAKLRALEMQAYFMSKFMDG